MIVKFPRRLLTIGIISIVVVTVLALSAIPVMAATTTTTITTATTTTTTTTTTQPKTTTTSTSVSSAVTTEAKPNVSGVSPNEASQGATLDVTINGTNFTGATKVSFGRGITVNKYNVSNDGAITANITIGDHAEAGSRFVTVVNPSGRGDLKAGFTVTKNESGPTPNVTTTTK